MVRWLLHCSSPETETGKSRELGARTAAEESAAILSSDNKTRSPDKSEVQEKIELSCFATFFYFKHIDISCRYLQYIYLTLLYATLAEHAVWRGRESIEGQSEGG